MEFRCPLPQDSAASALKREPICGGRKTMILPRKGLATHPGL
jgi:hypothetical protein